MITFIVPGKPIGKGRPRATTIGGHARMYTPAKTASYESKVALFCQQEITRLGLKPYDAGVPLSVIITAVFAIPQSWPKKRKAAAKWHTGKPDCDNIAKAVCDALNGIAWADDSQVAWLQVNKLYALNGEPEGVQVSIWAL